MIAVPGTHKDLGRDDQLIQSTSNVLVVCLRARVQEIGDIGRDHPREMPAERDGLQPR